MKLSQLRHVLVTAEFGGLRRASRHLSVAQPAITRSIRELEHELGVTLFERSASGMTLTPMGDVFVRRSRAAQLELERARDEIEQLKGAAAGVVAVGLSTAVHVALLPRVIIPFQRRYPDVRLRVMEGLFPVMKGGVRDGTIDFYVGPLSEEDVGGEFRSEKLFDNSRVVLARRGHPLEAATSLSEFTSASWVTTSVTMDSDAELSPLFHQHGLPTPRIAVHAHSALSMIRVRTR